LKGSANFPASISIGNDPRQVRFRAIIRDDNIYEELEYFTIILKLDTFIMQSGVVIDPNVTTIFIEDNDGM
jgi:hypothetical protein